MDNSNIKVYLAISGALIVLLILIIIIPFSKKVPIQNNTNNSNNQIFPTSVETNPSPITNNQSLTPIPADFTGAIDEPIPQQITDTSNQKRDLQAKVPLSLSTFTIDFNYTDDKFEVTLKEPKNTAQKEFESWRTANYPNLDSNQFLIK